jgi:hypothetical protein
VWKKLELKKCSRNPTAVIMAAFISKYLMIFVRTGAASFSMQADYRPRSNVREQTLQTSTKFWV